METCRKVSPGDRVKFGPQHGIAILRVEPGRSWSKVLGTRAWTYSTQHIRRVEVERGGRVDVPSWIVAVGIELYWLLESEVELDN